MGEVNPVPLRVWRLRKLLSQQVLADQAGTSARTILRIESGKPARIDTMHAICKALGVEPDAVEEFAAFLHANGAL